MFPQCRPPLALTALVTASLAFAQRPQTPPAPGAQQAEEKTTPIPAETKSVTEHDVAVDGKTLHYTATAGTLLINGADEHPYASVFYAAYTMGGTDPRTRPVTFLYNGGPGSASMWLHRVR